MRLFPQLISLLLTPVLMVGPLSAQTSPAASAVSGTAPIEALQLRVVGGESAEITAGSRVPQGFLLEVTDSSGAPVSDAAIAFRLPDADPTGIFSDGTHSAVVYTDQTGRAKIAGIQWNATPGTVAIRVTATKGTAHAGILIQRVLTPDGVGAAAPPLSHTAHEALPSAVAPLPLPAEAPAGTKPAKGPVPGQLATVSSLDAPLASATSEPAVSVTNSPTGASKHSGKTKWIILAAVAAAAGGAGVAMMGKKSNGGSAAAPTGISIGAPGISIGHP